MTPDGEIGLSYMTLATVSPVLCLTLDGLYHNLCIGSYIHICTIYVMMMIIEHLMYFYIDDLFWLHLDFKYVTRLRIVLQV